MEFPRQEYWSGLPFPSPGELPNPGIKLTAPATSPALQAGSLPLSHQGSCYYIPVTYITLYKNYTLNFFNAHLFPR